MTKRDDRILLLQAVAREVAKRAHMPVPDLRICKLKCRTAARTTIFHRNRITVNKLALYTLNRKELAILLAHEMGHLRYIWLSRILAINPFLALFALISIWFAKILGSLSCLLLLLLLPPSLLVIYWKLPEPVADRFAYRLYGKELCRKALKNMKEKLRRAAEAQVKG